MNSTVDGATDAIPWYGAAGGAPPDRLTIDCAPSWACLRVKMPSIRAWKSGDALDDQAPLSAVARASLAYGRWVKARGWLQTAKEEAFEQKFGDFLRLSPEIQRCQGLTVVDIGGGTGELAAHLASRGAKSVWCVEPDPEMAERARETLQGYDNARALQAPGEELRAVIGSADRVILHEVLPHVGKPLDLLMEVHDLLRPGGLAFVMFIPWGGPYGAHTRNLLPVPWLHLLYPKSVLAEMRSSEHGWHTKDLAATGLHRLRIGNFLDLTKQSGLELVHLQLLPVWRQEWATKWPGLRELGTMKLGAVLRRESFAA